jgi:hypothetical protein
MVKKIYRQKVLIMLFSTAPNMTATTPFVPPPCPTQTWPQLLGKEGAGGGCGHFGLDLLYLTGQKVKLN